jgi:hypothetical protein
LLAYTDEETHEQILNAQLWHTRIRHSPSLVEGELNRAICEALMELGAPLWPSSPKKGVRVT